MFLGHVVREVHRVWMASERPIKTKDKKEDCRIVQKSSMPWNQAGYKAQLQKDLKDIWQKLSRVLGQDLAKSDSSFVEATSPVECIEGGVLVDLCISVPKMVEVSCRCKSHHVYLCNFLSCRAPKA